MKPPCLARCLAVILSLGALSPVLAQNVDSPQITTLLGDARTSAARAQQDAEILEGYTRSNMAWQSHAAQLEKMRTDVNELGKVAGHLNNLRSEGSPWQQIAIDRIRPLLTEMAKQLTETINLLNEHRNLITNNEYRDYTHANYDLESRTASMISDFVEYGKAKATKERLESKLELPSGSE